MSRKSDHDVSVAVDRAFANARHILFQELGFDPFDGTDGDAIFDIKRRMRQAVRTAQNDLFPRPIE